MVKTKCFQRQFPKSVWANTSGITEFFSFPQVRYWHCLQISPKARVDRQELGLMGTLPLQQLLGGSPQQQGAGHRALTPLATRRGPAGLRRRIRDLLRCRGVPALAYISRLFCSASVSCVQCLE